MIHTNFDHNFYDKNVSSNLIPFSQSSEIISQLHDEKHKTLSKFNARFGGLCELICNRILIDHSLNNDGDDQTLIKKCITVERLNKDKIKKSHILDIHSLFRKVISFLFGIYPDNIFSCFDQWKLISRPSSINARIRSVNRKILGKGLKKIGEGEVLKLEVFSRNGLIYLDILY